MLNIALGSTSDDKKSILKNALEGLKIDSDIKGHEVESGITDQPLDEETTILGAKNRALAALEFESEAEIGIGLEGGLVEIENKGYFMVCASVVIDKDGHDYLGLSGKLQLPKEASQKIKRGEQFGQAIREFAQKHDKDPLINELTERLVTRKEAFTEAIRNSILSYFNKEHTH